MLGTAILVAAIGLGLASFRHLLIPLVGALVAFVAIPEVGVWSMPLPVVGGVNVGVVVIVVTGVVQLAFRLPQYASDVTRAPAIWLALAVWTVGGSITNFLVGTPAPGSWLEIVLAPPLAYLLVQRLAAQSTRAPRTLALTLVGLAAAEAVTALAIWAGALPQPFADAHGSFSYWWDPEFDRALGTTDHPLGLGGLMVIATALLPTIRRTVVVIPLGALFIATTAAAESRAAMAIAVAVFVVVLIRRRVSFVTTLALFGVAGVTVFSVLALSPDLVSGIGDKVADDNGSANARLIGLSQGLPTTLENPIVGGGFEHAITTARELGLGTSFENPTVMTALDWGLVASIALVIAQVVAIRRGLRTGAAPGTVPAGVAFAAYLQSYSSYALPSGTSMLLWIVLGLALARHDGTVTLNHTAKTDPARALPAAARVTTSTGPV